MSQTLNLGVEFDDRLSWSSHVRQMIFKESKYIRLSTVISQLRVSVMSTYR